MCPREGTSTLAVYISSRIIVGGVAQWLGRQSLAGGLSLIYAWLTCDHFVGKVSAMV